ncbi:hypothetical protein Ancab_027791 [Ancistrocladus abbreviatus]
MAKMTAFGGATALIFTACFFEFGISRPVFMVRVHVDENGRGSRGGAGEALQQNQQPPPPPYIMIGEEGGSREPQLSPPPIAAAPPISPLPQRTNHSTFKTSIAVVVGVLTTIFSMTFLLLLYAKHCKRGAGGISDYLGDSTTRGGGATPVSARKNSGIDRTVVELLPVFRFGSLTGQKEGLECAVCLNRFEHSEVLRLLPKCKHAFHVECVDTWLDAHSTCPLCRYRVDPEDVLLVYGSQPIGLEPELYPPEETSNISSESSRRSLGEKNRRSFAESTRRVSGRHSYAGERGGSRFSSSAAAVQIRKSYDESHMRTKSESVNAGCFDLHHHSRKDGLLMTVDRTSVDRRLDHRIIISDEGRERWSDIQPLDLLYLRSEMLMNESRRSWSSKGGQQRVSSCSRVRTQQRQQQQLNDGNSSCSSRRSIDRDRWAAAGGRSVSEITGLSRTPTTSSSASVSVAGERHRHERERQAGVVSRWTAWIYQSRTDLRSGL